MRALWFDSLLCSPDDGASADAFVLDSAGRELCTGNKYSFTYTLRYTVFV